MEELKYVVKLDLQLFAEGSGTGEGNATGQTEGTFAQYNGREELEDIRYGIQEEDTEVANPKEEAPRRDMKSEFEKLIKGEFKNEYSKKVQEAVTKRFKGNQDKLQQFEQMQPVLEMLRNRYGIEDASNVEELQKAIEDDDSFFEEEAMEKGISVEQLKTIRKMERENAALKQHMAQIENDRMAQKTFSDWMEQAEALKVEFPDFNLEAELENQTFRDILTKTPNIDVRTAYVAVHQNEFVSQTQVRKASEDAERRAVAKIINRGIRPSENGTNKTATATVKSDVSQLSDKDIDEIYRRVSRGDKISFG